MVHCVMRAKQFACRIAGDPFQKRSGPDIPLAGPNQRAQHARIENFSAIYHGGHAGLGKIKDILCGHILADGKIFALAHSSILFPSAILLEKDTTPVLGGARHGNRMR